MADDCIFCKIVSGELPSTKFYEDENFVVIKNIHPVVKSHMLVITKKHFTNFIDLDSELYEKLLEVVSCVVGDRGIKDFNLIVNNGKLAGQLVEHFHLHILPREKNDNVSLGV